MILCFTTTVRPLYHRDLLDLVCLERGGSVRFGYKEEHIQPYYHGHGRIQGWAWVIFADYVTEGGVARYEFYPVRHVWASEDDPVGVSDGGRSLTLDVRSGGYFDYVRFNQSVFDTWIRSLTHRPTLEGPNNAYLCYAPNPEDTGGWFGGTDWSTTTVALGQTKGLRKSTLYRRATRASGHSGLKLGSTLAVERASGTIISGRSYDIALDVRPPQEGQLHLPEFSVSEGAGVHGPFVEQGFGGLVSVQYRLDVPMSLAGRHLSARLGHAKQEELEDQPRRLMPELHVSAAVRPSARTRARYFACGILLASGNLLMSDVLPFTESAPVATSLVGAALVIVGVGWLLGLPRLALGVS